MKQEPCRFDTLCTRANCPHHHSCMSSGKSPETEKCRYGFECTRKKCPFLHDTTLDGRSPAFVLYHDDATASVTASVTATDATSRVAIVTWNILSESHAQKMTAYDPNVLDTDFRWSLLSSQLSAWMQKEFIVCLQEVTRDLGFSRLKALATALNYEVVYRSYGTESNGFMGNAVLVPLQRFSVEKFHHVRVGALCSLPNARGFPHLLTSVLLHDVESGDHFFVSSYHMPCQYKKPEIMDAHCEALNKVLSVARFPWFLAGDFNMLPDDVCRNFQGYKILAGTSPTTHSCIRDTVFRGRLDHIVFSNLFQIEEEIPVHSVESLMPNAEQPSDHECVAAFFSLKN